MVTIKLLGAVYVDGAAELRDRAAAQRHRLALLALLATARDHILPREKLMALLWPDRNAEQVRKLLNQSVYVLRRALGDNALISTGGALKLDARSIDCDAINFERAVAAGDLQRAVELYTGPFLDGFFLHNAGEFDSWAERQRARLADSYALALAELGDAAHGCGDYPAALRWRHTLAVHDPLDSSVALRLMESLEATGDPAGALLQAEIHERALKAELGIRPPAELVSAVARLQGLQRSTTPKIQVATNAATPNPAATNSTDDDVTAAAIPADSSKSPRFRRYALIAAVALLLVFATTQWSAQFSQQSRRSAIDVSPEVESAATREQVTRRRADSSLPGTRETGTNSIAALELYRRGNDPTLNRNNSAARQAIAYFREAVTLDPQFAEAWAGLARSSLRVAAAGEFAADAELYFRAEEAARQALAIDPATAEAHAVLGMLRLFDFDLLAAEPLLHRAVELEPDRPAFQEWIISLHLWMGRPELALEHAERAVNLDPFSPSATAEFARALLANGRPDDAIEQIELLTSVNPPLLRVSIIAAQSRAAKAQWQAAIAELQSGPARTGPLQQALLSYLSARAGDVDTARRIRETLFNKWQHGSGDAVLLAVVDAGLGDLEQAALWFERALEDQSLAATPDQYTLLEPVMQELRGHARFDNLPPLAHWLAANSR